tara:strand:+ start:1124 stop:2179 length:1056 start_codon:yes stop_codon:yes gene_type:complete
MSNLTEMKSILDRQVKGVEGANVGVTNPSDGNYYTVEGSADSPFDSNDHMVDLMTKDILSENSGITHQKSPNKPGHFQDLDGTDGGNGYFHGLPNPGKGQGKQLGGKDLHEKLLTTPYNYTHGNSSEHVGASPGETGNSEYQDLDGQKGPIFGDASGEGKKLGGKDLHEGLLTKHYTYQHGGFSTTILQRKSGAGGAFDIDAVDGGNGYFHDIPNPGKLQGKQLGGKDLHERMLTHAYTKNNVTVGPSPGPSGHSEFQDLDGSMTDAGNGYFHGMPNPGKFDGKQLGGVDLHEAMLTQAYINNGVTVGPSPGPSGHSTFQDLDGVLPFANKPLGQFGGPYKNGKGPSDGHY